MAKKPDLNKTSISILLMNIIEILIIFSIFIYGYYFDSNMENPKLYGIGFLFIIIIIIVTANTILILRERQLIHRWEKQFQIVKESLNQVESLNVKLRAQRHDFMNHLQVVYSLIEMEEFEEANRYINKVYNDIQKVGKILKTANPAINALLLAKLLSCEKRGIQTELNVTTKLDNLKIPDWEFCKILGNLIDNSMYALLEIKTDKLLVVELFENITSYEFIVKNNGPEIPDEIKEKIFQVGFTTKGDSGDGMGLPIALDTLKEYGGTIKLRSENNFTIFQGTVPKNSIEGI